jgi:PAS domain S-box-containing protein
MKQGYTKIGKTVPLLSWDVCRLQDYTPRQLLKEDVLQLEMLARQWQWQHGWNFSQAIQQEHKTILVTDLQQQILFASSALQAMAGYMPWEVVGKSPRIFQGAATNEVSRALIRTALQQQQPFATTLTNYRKGGGTYDCYIEGFPVRNRQGALVNYIAFEQALP